MYKRWESLWGTWCLFDNYSYLNDLLKGNAEKLYYTTYMDMDSLNTPPEQMHSTLLSTLLSVYLHSNYPIYDIGNVLEQSALGYHVSDEQCLWSDTYKYIYHISYIYSIPYYIHFLSTCKPMNVCVYGVICHWYLITIFPSFIDCFNIESDWGHCHDGLCPLNSSIRPRCDISDIIFTHLRSSIYMQH